MKNKQIHYSPDAPASTGGTAPAASTAPAAAPTASAPVSTPPSAPSSNPGEVSAQTALGLGESPREALATLANRPKGRPAPQSFLTPETSETSAAAALKPATPPTTAPAAKPTTVKPAAPAAKPPTPPAAAPKPAAPKPVVAAAPAKIKIGGKEYTADQLERLLAPAPAASAPAPAAPAEPSPEDVAAAESRFVDEFATQVGAVPIEEADLEKVLLGGKEGATALTALLQKTTARAVLETRKSIYQELNPALAAFQQQLQPLAAQQVQLEQYRVAQQFQSTFPEYTGDHLAQARSVAELLYQQYPEAVAKMTPEQFIAETERQTNAILETEFRRWNPNAAGTWKDHVKAAAVPAEPPEAPPVRPPVRPPAGNSPSSGAGAGAAATSWSRGIASTLIS